MNHRHLLTVLKLSLTAVLLAAIGVSQADADTKVYPGLMCINRYNTGIPVYEEKGTIGNDSATAWLRIGWPIVRDGSRVTSAGVQVIDLNSAQYIECRIIRAFRSGDQTIIRYSYVGRSTEDRVGPDGVGGTGWVWGSLDELGSPGTYSHYVVSCIIPPRAEGVSKMVTYRVTED